MFTIVLLEADAVYTPDFQWIVVLIDFSQASRNLRARYARTTIKPVASMITSKS